FLRNGIRALRAAKASLSSVKLAYASILGTLWGLTIPYALQMEVNRSFELIAGGKSETIRVQGMKLRLLAPIVDAEELRRTSWSTLRNSEEQREIRLLYYQLSGKQIDEYNAQD